MQSKLVLSVLGGAMALGLPASANAAQLVHFAINGGYTASFDLDASPTPSRSDSTSFTINDVGGTFAGVGVSGGTKPATASQATGINFYIVGKVGDYTSTGGIGIDASNLTRFVGSGTQFFTGSTSAPTFVPGVYTVAPFYTYGPALVTITSIIGVPISGAVPEPSSWALMIGGLSLVGGGLRRARRSARSGHASQRAALAG